MALANETGFPHEGYINFVENRLDPATGTLQIRGSFDNPPLPDGSVGITSGLFSRVRLELGSPYKALLVSERAILTDQGTKFVYVVDNDNRVVRHDVTVGRLEDGLREIASGLAAADRVVTNGLQRVRPGIVVEPQEGPMPMIPKAKMLTIRPVVEATPAAEKASASAKGIDKRNAAKTEPPSPRSAISRPNKSTPKQGK
jgi:hypothetical protein